jgi:hypothetical protein
LRHEGAQRCDISFDLVDCAMIAAAVLGSSMLVAIEQIMPNT